MQHLIQRSFLIALITIEVCFIVGFWVWTGDSREQLAVQYERGDQLMRQREQLQDTIRMQHAYRDAITQDRSFLEHVAREKMGFAASDEWIFIVPESIPGGFEE
ncbi:MAG: hypothetical protein AAF212_08465 [Verrucomicrobiota bacterium]